jgi:hypothetical protein
MTFKTFIYNALLTLLMGACFVCASYLGMTAAIKHLDAQERAMWSVAKGGNHD